MLSQVLNIADIFALLSITAFEDIEDGRGLRYGRLGKVFRECHKLEECGDRVKQVAERELLAWT